MKDPPVLETAPSHAQTVKLMHVCLQLAKSGSLSRSWSDLDMWKQPAVGACVAKDAGLAMEDSAEGLCLLGKSLELPYVPEQASQPPDCRVE